MATKPNGLPNNKSASDTPIKPSGAVSTTIAVREKLLSWIISKVRTTMPSNGTPATIDFCPLLESSNAPPASIR